MSLFKKTFEEMSLEELINKNLQYMKDILELRIEQKELNVVMAQKQADKALLDDLAKLKAAHSSQTLSPAGLKSAAKMGYTQ